MNFRCENRIERVFKQNSGDSCNKCELKKEGSEIYPLPCLKIAPELFYADNPARSEKSDLGICLN